MNEVHASRSDKQRSWKRRIVRLVCLVSGILLGACLMLAFLQRKLMYVPEPGPVHIDQAGLPENRLREVFLHVAKKVELNGWYCQAEAHRQRSHPRLVILFPGNGGNRLNRVRLMQLVNELGCDVLIFDYRGYGGSDGTPTEESIAADSLKVWDFAQNELGFDSRQIVVYGQSLGGGVSTRLVWELCEQGDPPAGLILQATFTSMVDAAKVHYPWLPVNALLVDRYPSIQRIPKIDCPILFLHGEQDEIVPYELGQTLFEAAPEVAANGIPKRFVHLPDADHNNILHVAREELQTSIGQFLDQIDQATTGGN